MHPIKTAVVAASLGFLACACATKPAPTSDSPPRNTPTYADFNDKGLIASIHRIATANVLPADRAPRNFAAVGYVLLPRNISQERALAACQALFFTLPMDTAIQQRGVPPSKRVPTFWVTTKQPAVAFYCSEVIPLYDYTRADLLASAAKVAGLAGPVLVAWHGNGPNGSGDVFSMDLSQVATRDFDEAFRLWQRHVTDDESIWDGISWNLDKFRLAAKTFVDKYGKDCVSAVKAAKELFF